MPSPEEAAKILRPSAVTIDLAFITVLQHLASDPSTLTVSPTERDDFFQPFLASAFGLPASHSQWMVSP